MINSYTKPREILVETTPIREPEPEPNAMFGFMLHELDMRELREVLHYFRTTLYCKTITELFKLFSPLHTSFICA